MQVRIAIIVFGQNETKHSFTLHRQPLLTVSINECKVQVKYKQLIFLFFFFVCLINAPCTVNKLSADAADWRILNTLMLQNANHVSKICLVRLVRIRGSFRPSPISHCLLVPST